MPLKMVRSPRKGLRMRLDARATAEFGGRQTTRDLKDMGQGVDGVEISL